MYGAQPMDMTSGGLKYGAAKAVSVNRFFGLRRYRRMNIAAICLSLFAPWLLFCAIHALLSFRIHYDMPAICYIFAGACFIALASVWAHTFFQKVRAATQAQGEHQSHHTDDFIAAVEQAAAGDWFFFILTTALIGFVVGVVLGTKNFWYNTQPYYDLQNLNHYTGISTNKTHGQELMDAGQVSYERGTTINTRYGIGFRNVDTYCVAPIVPQNTPPLEVYDFWAVGVNCCSGGPGDFECSGTKNGVPTGGGGGLRVMLDEDRAFYRLAVQQAQSAFQVRAKHPLFFYWVSDPAAAQWSYLQESMRQYLIAMYVAFGIQGLLVAVATCTLSSQGAA
eukprot:TRINITY_DN90977_c0_g1_i1.p1 TRINITY_DN90977_c0_g1~~TRINITY_DN90977_c0_g1_i1.p1  ORF type:complete len:336 (+),score=71.03 TRINITY_DN90977_c0_g1_i1:102-1109(+)